MMNRKICRYSLMCIGSVLVSLVATAQSHKHADVHLKDTVPLLADKQIFFNVAGVVLWQFSDYGEVEGGVRLNLKRKFFPVIEFGLGMCDKTHDETDIHYKTSSPFVRIGCDYNFIKNKSSNNRILGGLRLSYSSFKYDMDAPPLNAPMPHGVSLSLVLKQKSGVASVSGGRLVTRNALITRLPRQERHGMFQAMGKTTTICLLAHLMRY